jgi:hypothetical protein
MAAAALMAVTTANMGARRGGGGGGNGSMGPAEEYGPEHLDELLKKCRGSPDQLRKFSKQAKARENFQLPALPHSPTPCC